jgi:hypothetical protein
MKSPYPSARLQGFLLQFHSRAWCGTLTDFPARACEVRRRKSLCGRAPYGAPPASRVRAEDGVRPLLLRLAALCKSALGSGYCRKRHLAGVAAAHAVFQTAAKRALYHCASSNGVMGPLTLGLGSMFRRILARPASPPPPIRMFRGEPLTIVTCEG